MARWYATAPSNIALIKYMGKTDASVNKPSNASLSLTLPHLNTYVELEAVSKASESGSSGDSWEPLSVESVERLSKVVDIPFEKLREKIQPVELSDKGQARFLKHLKRVKDYFNYQGSFVIRSGNDFPSDCGLASSASSFAALTLVAYRALSELTSLTPEQFDESKVAGEISQMAELSRQGSGSSCRSFCGPWGLWQEDGSVESVDLRYNKLLHMVIVVDDKIKKVSSSEAHLRVAESLNFQGRIERVNRRLQDLIRAFREKEWKPAFEICWAEFWDMHALFETSHPSFGYMTAETLAVLNEVREIWNTQDDGPICTMDAGPNVHLLFRQDQSELARKMNEKFSSKEFGDLKTFVNF